MQYHHCHGHAPGCRACFAAAIMLQRFTHSYGTSSVVCEHQHFELCYARQAGQTCSSMTHAQCIIYMQSGDVSAVADLGGSILTGIDGNPLAVLAKQLHIPLHVIDEADVPLYQADGREANAGLDQEASLTLHLLHSSAVSVQSISGEDVMPDVHDKILSVWEWCSVMQCACCAGHSSAKQKSIACDSIGGFQHWL